MVGNIKVGDQFRQTNIRFRNMNDFASYIISFDQDYDRNDSIFNGYVYKIDTPQFEKVNRSQNGNGCDFKHQLIEYRGNNCLIPSNGYCSVKCVKFLTGKNYKQQCLDFIRSEKGRTFIMTKAKIQPFVEQIILI